MFKPGFNVIQISRSTIHPIKFDDDPVLTIVPLVTGTDSQKKASNGADARDVVNTSVNVVLLCQRSETSPKDSVCHAEDDAEVSTAPSCCSGLNFCCRTNFLMLVPSSVCCARN